MFNGSNSSALGGFGFEDSKLSFIDMSSSYGCQVVMVAKLWLDNHPFDAEVKRTVTQHTVATQQHICMYLCVWL